MVDNSYKTPLLCLLLNICVAYSNSIVSIPYELTYLLPSPFNGDISHTFVNGTNTSSSSINSLLQLAAQAPFIAYDEEFLTLLGPDPSAELIDEPTLPPRQVSGSVGATKSGTSWVNDGPTRDEILNLTDKSIRGLNTSRPLENPNGGYYHNGFVYFTCLRDDSRGWPGGVVSVEPETGHVETVLNSYFGLRFDNIDDVAWGGQNDTLPQGLWRWDPQAKLLLPAISRTELPVANGVRCSTDQKTLWVTDFGGAERSRVWGMPAEVGAPAIYKYSLDEDMWPTNKRIFGISRMQAPDGIRVDDQGRVWTGEGEGIVVRAADGRIIGVFNAQYFTKDPISTAIVQFALAGDTLVVLGQNRLWTVKLAETVSSS
ncbi:hypothetical protein BJX61DRAFT_542475 [Aspergillus egyptiacus]|nr:hypothetical protein BJX61DRAFT_542475 [Aspergillus egyptiacus]